MRAFRLVVEELRPYLKSLVLGLCCLILTNLCAVAIPQLIKDSIDNIKQLSESSLSTNFSQIYFLLKIIVIVAFLQFLFRIFSRIIFFNTARACERTMRSRIFEHLQKLPIDFFQVTPSGEMMSRLTNDITYVRAVLGVVVLQITNTIISYALAVPAIIVLNWKLALMVMTAFPFAYVAGTNIIRRIFQESKHQQQVFGDMTSSLNETFSGYER